jgi:hypothetical protein
VASHLRSDSAPFRIGCDIDANGRCAINLRRSWPGEATAGVLRGASFDSHPRNTMTSGNARGRAVKREAEEDWGR